MEKVAFIIDGGFFAKKYNQLNKKILTADDIEKYTQNILKFLNKTYPHPVAIYRIFYYDCPPLHNLSRWAQTKKPAKMNNSEFKKICDHFEKKYQKIKKFHDQIKRKNFFALRMGQLNFQGWEQINEKGYWRPQIQQKGVDMRIGLDIASITGKKLCSKIVLISGDTDMIPAMKVARKEGVHVCWHDMDDAQSGSNLNLATHSDIIIKNEHLTKLKQGDLPHPS